MGKNEKEKMGSRLLILLHLLLSFEHAIDYIRFLEGKISQPFPSAERESRLYLRHSGNTGSNLIPRQTKHLIGTHP